MAKQPASDKAPSKSVLRKIPKTIKTVGVASLKSDPNNPNKHGAKNLQSIDDSFDQFGQLEPLLVQKSTGVVISGNGRLARLVARGVEDVQITELDVNDETAQRISLVMNRTGQLAELDEAVVMSIINEAGKSGVTAKQLGYTESEVDVMLDSIRVDSEAGGGGNPLYDSAFEEEDLVEQIQNKREKDKLTEDAAPAEEDDGVVGLGEEGEEETEQEEREIECPHCKKSFPMT